MVKVLHEFRDLVNPKDLPKKTKELHYYLAGFADAEGCFSVSVKPQESARWKFVIDPIFQVTQHKNNEIVIKLFLRVLKCGRIIQKPGQEDLLLFLVDNRRQLKEKILPFFEKYVLLAKKRDFEKFREIILRMENKEHFTKEGFCSLVKIAFEMNMQGKQRRYSLEEILREIDATKGSSETIRQSANEAHDIVHPVR